MAFRKIPHKDRVEAILGCIEIKNTKEMAKKYNISEAMLSEDCDDLLLEVDEMLKKRNLAGRLKIKLKKLFQKLT